MQNTLQYKNSVAINEGMIFSNAQSKVLQNQNLKRLKLKVGDVSIVTIQALGTKNVGLAEIANGYTVIVPKAKLGETVKIKIDKISLKPKYATAKLLEVIKESAIILPIQVGEVLNVTIEKQGPQNSGLTSLSKNFTLIVKPIDTSSNFKIGEQIKVRITRVKENYAFAENVSENIRPILKPVISTTLSSELKRVNESLNSLIVGSTFNLYLPKTAKQLKNYVVIKLKNSLVFVKMNLGVELGEKVRIKIVKTSSKYAIAEITKVSPMSKNAKELLVKQDVKKMIMAGMHYGEKAIRCHANMRKFLWIRKKGKNQNRPLMKRGRHVINILKTRSCLNKTLQELAKYAAKGKTFLFVGTKKPAASLIARTAMLTKTSYFVNTRWLGGMLTNWKTILKSISQIKPILKEKQKLIQKILEKRQKIKKRLLKKVNLLRKKSEKLLIKGKELIGQIKQDKNILFTRSQQLILKKNEVIEKNKQLLHQYSELKLKKQKLAIQYQLLKENGQNLVQQKTKILAQIDQASDRLNEFKQLSIIGYEILKLKQEFQKTGKNLWTVSFENSARLATENNTWLIPNPSLSLLNKMVQMMKLKYENKVLDSNQLNALNSTNRTKSNTTETVVISQLLNKLTDYLPFIQGYMKNLVIRIETLQLIATKIDENIKSVREKMLILTSSALLSKIEKGLNQIGQALKTEKANLTLLKQKLKQLAAEQKLLKFLPKLRYLPTSKKKMLETVEFLMKRFVDPKMTYSMEQIYNDKLKFTSKKLAATRKQKWQRLEKYFGGITKMAKMKTKQIQNNVVILVGQQEEMNAVRECRKLGMKLFTIVDTNCNPRFSDYIIPANDDSRNSIKFILGQMLTYIRLGQKLRKKILSKRIASNDSRRSS
uniref:Small ribosomal subunit protein uS2c n=1 Tax=Raphidocelis subcapitata TaxID=307507 RepID=A0A2Z6FBN2_9CHLO|nr:30S ribosomal protein S2 [Raphidocelis subcapitata]